MNTRLSLLLAVMFCMALSLGQALAVQPDEMLADPALEARARALSTQLRCVVCQNQTIDDSNAPLARDLRVLLRERIAAGDSDDTAMAYLVERYGAYILLKPPFSATTLLLWLGPVLLLLAAIAGFWVSLKRRSKLVTTPPAELGAEDRALVDRILKGERTA